MNNTAELALSVNAPTGSLVRARWSTRVQFAALGILSGAWGAHVPSIKQHFDLTEASLSMLLLAVAFGVLFSLMFVGRVVEKLTARGGALVGGLLIASALAAVLHAPGFVFAFPIAFLLGASMSLFDVSINAEGTELEHVGGKPIMSNLHGMFSTGGMAGAAFVALLLRSGMAPAQQLALISGVLAVVIAFASRGMLITHSTSDEPQQNFAWPRGLLLVIGLLILAGMVAEGVMYDWGVLYLKQEVGMPLDQAALGYAAFSAAMALSRFSGDYLRERFSEERLLLVGGATAAVAMAVVLLSGNAWVALGGFVLVGAGLAPVAPVLFSAATRVPGVSRAAAIASVTSIGYAGFMIGPPLIGGLAHATSLTVALSVIVVSASLLAFGARFVPTKRG